MELVDADVDETFPPLGVSRVRSDLVVDSIKAAIISGRLHPGEVLVERKIAEKLGVSKTPVREALIVLAQSGLVELTRNRGMAVRTLTPTDIRHVYEQRLLLEPWAVANGTRSPHADFSLAAQALLDAHAHAADGNTAERALANSRFHRAMYSSCENGFVTQTLDRLRDVTALATANVLWKNWPTGDIESLEHQAIYDAAVAGEPELAERLTRDHIAAAIPRVAAIEAAGK